MHPYSPASLSPIQLSLLSRPLTAKIFLEGPSGTGKTTAAVERLLHLLAAGVSPTSILLLVPYRALLAPYFDAVQRAGVSEQISLLTFAALTRRMVEWHWSVIAAEAGFAHPENPPIFLNLEAAQIVMARLVQPLLVEGFFEGVALPRNRLYTQILDNLNKAAVVRFPLAEIALRLKSACAAESGAARRYDEAQEAASRFRQYCLQHNLLDFSLQVEAFVRCVWANPTCRADLAHTYRHILADNVEEGVPVMHDVLADWLPDVDSALLIYDADAGYRRFLGADPQSGYALKRSCAESLTFGESFTTPQALQAFGMQWTQSLQATLSHPGSSPRRDFSAGRVEGSDEEEAGGGVELTRHRFYPEMLDWTAERIARCLAEGTPPRQVAVLAPFMPDYLCFSLTERLKRRGIAAVVQRPSRPLGEDPAVRCLLTLARLAHPTWGEPPARPQVAHAFTFAIAGMDAVRAQLLSEIVYRVRGERPVLTSFERLQAEMRARITSELEDCYTRLYVWVKAYSQGESENLPRFFERLIAEVLTQPGFRFAEDFPSIQQLIASARNWEAIAAQLDYPLSPEFLHLIEEGLLTAQYPIESPVADAVLLSPAYTFLMDHRVVDYQFWLDIGSPHWMSRLHQPLTHPYVLSRQWLPGAQWGYAEEISVRQQALARLVLGLIRRCRRGIFLAYSELDEQGYEQRGGLTRVIDQSATAPATMGSSPL